MADLAPRARRLAAAGQADAWAIADEALTRAAGGEPLILLTLGDPEGPPHPAILAATTAALDSGRTHYSPLLGEPALRAAVAAHAGAGPGNIAIVPGAQHAAFAILALIAGTGQEVLLSDPYYATYPGVVAACGATAVAVPARADLSIDVAAIIAAITPRTGVIFLNSPANPSGAALDAADFRALGAACTANDLWLVVDEVYAAFRYDGPHIGGWQHGPEGRTIILSSFSKSHAMTGYRVGWIVAPEPVIAAMADWSAAAMFGVNQFVQDAALAALALPASALAAYHGGFARRARLVTAMAGATPGLAARMPAGGMFVMLDHRAITADDTGFARALLDATGVATTPGSGFGAAGAGHLRLSLCPSDDRLAAALARIADFATARAHAKDPA